VIVRREPLHPGAQQTLDDIDGKRFTAFLTDQTDKKLALLDTRHRARSRTASAAPKIPARATCRATHSNATPSGCSWS
jgi:hypothetical protein